MTEESAVQRETVLRDADNMVVWLRVDSGDKSLSTKEKLSLIHAEIQSICNDHISTLDDGMSRKNPRPNPAPRVFIEQGNELSQFLWLRWEE